VALRQKIELQVKS